MPGLKKEYRNESIAVTWEPAFCAHTARCLRGAPAVFDTGRRPWIVLEGADPDHVARVVASCPTGALHFTRLDGGAQEQPEPETTIVPLRDGPLAIRGAVTILGEDGEVIRSDTRVSLCRCGASQNKPFCDASHRRIGFRTDSPRTDSPRTDSPRTDSA